MATTCSYNDGMKNSATITASAHISDITNIKVQFDKLTHTGGTVFRIVCGYTPIVTLFFENDEDAKTFATETWLRWTDYDLGVI